MKRRIVLVLGLFTFVGYLLIAVSYNSRFTQNVFAGILKSIDILIYEKPVSFLDFIKDPFFWIAVVLLFFLYSVFTYRINLILTSSLLLIGLWVKNLITFGGIIDVEMYKISSLMFFVAVFSLNLFAFLYPEKSNSNH